MSRRYGYRIRNGKALIEPSEAACLNSFFTLYAEGKGIKDAARSAGVTLSTGACRNMLSKRVYLGTDYYPQLVDEDLFKAVQEEKERRGMHLKGVSGAKRKEAESVKTRFKMVRRAAASTVFQDVMDDRDETDPAAQARALYSQILTVDPEPERVERKKRNRKGAWRGTVPYGFEKDERGKLQIHNAEAEVVRRIFEDLASGRSMRSVAEELNDEGITTKRGKLWLEGTLRRIVWNPLYKQVVDSGLFEEAGRKVREKFRGSREAAPSVPQVQPPAVEDIDLPTVDNHTDFQEPSGTVENWMSYHPEDVKVCHTKPEDVTAPDPSSFPHDMLYHGYSQPGESSESVEHYNSDAGETLCQYNGSAGEAGNAADQNRSGEEGTHALYGKQCPFVRGHFLCPLFDPCPDCPALPVREPQLVERSMLEHQMDGYAVAGQQDGTMSVTSSGTSPPGNGPAPSYTVDSRTVSNHALSDTGSCPQSGLSPQSDDGTTSTEDTLHGGKQVVKIINAGNGYPGAPSHLRVTGRVNDRTSKLTRVAAYARVSTDSEEQESSYEAQVDHYTRYINDSILHPDWTFAGMYADEGISGTSTRNRTEFHRMISDCEEGKVDLVLVKSISRLARNTVDSLNTIRKLKDLGIGIIFEKEGINTLDAAGEVLITILSSLAQQESESISQNVRMGLQYRMQEGKGSLNTDRFLGYRKREGSKYEYEIVEEEAEIVRRIYREFLDGYSPAIIARHLERDSILSPAGRKKWYGETVRSILTNEKYCGDVLLQKYFVENCLTHKLVRNTGQMPQYFVENHHDPVVPKAVFFQVQGEMERRSNATSSLASGGTKGTGETSESGRTSESGGIRCNEDLPFTGRVVCGNCNRAMRRFRRRLSKHNNHAAHVENDTPTSDKNNSTGTVKNSTGTMKNSTGTLNNSDTGTRGTGGIGETGSAEETVVVEWRCYDRENQRHSRCGSRAVRESELEAAVVEALNRILLHRDELLKEQAGIWKGELKRIDALLEVNREQAMAIESRLAELETINDMTAQATGSMSTAATAVTEEHGCGCNDAHSVDASSGDAHSGIRTGAVNTTGADNTEADEAERLSRQLDELTASRSALLLERAEWANKEVRIRLLLELADEMRRRRDRAWETWHGGTIPDSSDAGRMDIRGAEDSEITAEQRDEGEQGEQGAIDPACRNYDDFFRRTRTKYPGNVLNHEGTIVGFDRSLVIRYVDRVIVTEDGFEVGLKAGISIKV